MRAVTRVAEGAERHRARVLRAVARVERQDPRRPDLPEVARAVGLLLVEQRIGPRVPVGAVANRGTHEEREVARERKRERGREGELVVLRLVEVALRIAAVARLVAEAEVARRVRRRKRTRTSPSTSRGSRS